MFTHPCVKCGKNYRDEDPEPFYCLQCNIERKAIAAKVDKEFAGRVRDNQQSDFQRFEEQARKLKTPDGRTVSLMNATNL